MEDLPTVSLVVLNFNGRNLLGPCLESLDRLVYPPGRLELVLCDNGSSDGSAEEVRRTHPAVKVIPLDRNYGFAEGNNRAARAATGEWVGFLNNDMRVEPDWLERMVTALDAHPGAACVSSKILTWDGKALDFVGAGINFQGFGFQFDTGASESAYDQERRIMCPCGGAMLIRRELFLEVGGFDPEYFAFYEDTDLGWRLNVLGHDVWYVPDAVVYHHHHGTASRLPEYQRRFLYERNALFTMYKCLDDDNLAAALPASLILLNEKALNYSAVDRDRVRPDLDGERPASTVAEVDQPPRVDRPGLGSRAAATLRKQGWRGVLAKSRRYAAVRARLAGDRIRETTRREVAGRLRRRLNRDAEVVSLESVACQVALAEFARSLESLREKRGWVQSRRRRSDAELLPLFHFALEPSLHAEPYVPFQRRLMKVLGLDERFGAGQVHGRS